MIRVLLVYSLLAALPGLLRADPAPAFSQAVRFAESHDVCQVWLQGGRKLTVVFGDPSHETVAAWRPGRHLTLRYARTEGVRLVDDATGKSLEVLDLTGEHPIDALERRAIARDGSTLGMRQAAAQASRRWASEQARHHGALVATLPPRARTAFDLAQRAWIAYRDAQVNAIRERYGARSGTLWPLVADRRICRLHRARALQLAGLRAD